MPYGRQVLTGPIVYPTRCSFEGSPIYKAGGLTIDLATLPAAQSVDVKLPDQSVIRAGSQFARYGQVWAKITSPQVYAVSLTGSPTGGTFTITVNGQNTAQTTAPIVYNAAAAAVQSALASLGNIGANNVTVSGAGPYTVTLFAAAGTPIVSSDGSGLTGGTSPAATTTSSSTPANTGKFGPFDPAATDGRQTLTRGECFVQDETVLFSPYGAILPSANDVRGGVIEGGKVWLQRLLQCGTGAPSLAAGPTLAQLMAAFPLLMFVEN